MAGSAELGNARPVTVTAYLALGANLGDPMAQIEAAVGALERADVSVRTRAPLYRSAPVGPPGQPDYVNTVLEVETDLAPEALLDLAKAIETQLGRTPNVRWGARVIDIDIALYGDRQISTPRLTVPHVELTRRPFVLVPLAELCPQLKVPGTNHTVTEHLDALERTAGDLSLIEDDRRPS